MPPGLTIPSTFVAVDRFSLPLRTMGGAIGSFVNRSTVGLARVEMAFRRIMSPLVGLQNMLRGVGVYIGLFSAIMLMRNSIAVMADFEQAQVNIAAVTGVAVAKNKILASQARNLALDYGIAAKAVLEMDLALTKAGHQRQDVMNMNAPILTGAIALNAPPEAFAKTTNAVLKAFKKPTSETQDVVDKMVKAADLSVMDWSDLETMLPRAAQSAALANMSFEQLLATFAALRDAQVHVASGAVATKNMLIKGAMWGKDFNEMLDKIIASPNKIKQAYKMFGSKTLVSALPLAEARQLGNIERFMNQLTASYKGYADQVARVRLDSIRGRITLFRRSWEELILSVDDGTGPVGKALKQYLDVGAAMLLISADSEAARGKLSTMDATVVQLANKYLGWLKIIGGVTAAIIALRIAIILWHTVMIAARALMIGWNIIIGINTALTWGNVMALRGNVIALTAYRVAVMLARGATLLFSGALLTSPYGLVAIGLGVLVAMLLKSSKAYDSLTMSATNANKAMTLSKAEEKARENLIATNRNRGFDKPAYMERPGYVWQYSKFRDKWFEVPKDSSVFGMFSSLFKEQKSFAPSTNPMDSLGAGLNMKEFINLDSIKQQSIADQLQLIQSGNVSIDINNKSGLPVNARSSGNADITMRPQSTFMDFE